MKKLFAILAVITAMFFMPKIADAAEDPCWVDIVCDNYVTICDGIDYNFWNFYYCGPIDD